MANEYNSPVTRGMQKIEFGLIPPDGGVATNWFVLGYTRRETFSFTSEDGTDVNLYAEEADAPVTSFITPGTESFEFDLMNFNLETLVKVFGGRIEGEGDDAVYYAPKTYIPKEWSCKITPITGYIFTYPRISITPSLSGSFTREELVQIHIVCTILEPTNSEVARYSVEKLTQPKTDLSTLITNTALGELTDNQAATILSTVKDLNPLLDIAQVEADNITTTGAAIKASKDSVYLGSVTVTFTIA